MEVTWLDSTKFAPNEIPALRASLQVGHSLALIKWLLAVLRALGVCAIISVVHGDVKPPNIMILPNGDAALIDFGASRLVEDGEFGTEQVGGTSEYMAPEGFHISEDGRGGVISPASDVFAFGVMSGELIDHHVWWIFSAVAPELAWKLQRALSHDPSNRPTIDELADVFEQAQGRVQQYAPNGSGSIWELMSLQSSARAVASCHKFADLHQFVEVARMSLAPEVKQEVFPAGWDMRKAWLACDAVGKDSAQLLQYLHSVKLRFGERAEEVLSEVKANLEKMDLAMTMVRTQIADEGFMGNLQQAADINQERFDTMYAHAFSIFS